MAYEHAGTYSPSLYRPSNANTKACDESNVNVNNRFRPMELIASTMSPQDNNNHLFCATSWEVGGFYWGRGELEAEAKARIAVKENVKRARARACVNCGSCLCNAGATHASVSSCAWPPQDKWTRDELARWRHLFPRGELPEGERPFDERHGFMKALRRHRRDYLRANHNKTGGASTRASLAVSRPVQVTNPKGGGGEENTAAEKLRELRESTSRGVSWHNHAEIAPTTDGAGDVEDKPSVSARALDLKQKKQLRYKMPYQAWAQQVDQQRVEVRDEHLRASQRADVAAAVRRARCNEAFEAWNRRKTDEAGAAAEARRDERKRRREELNAKKENRDKQREQEMARAQAGWRKKDEAKHAEREKRREDRAARRKEQEQDAQVAAKKREDAMRDWTDRKNREQRHIHRQRRLERREKEAVLQQQHRRTWLKKTVPFCSHLGMETTLHGDGEQLYLPSEHSAAAMVENSARPCSRSDGGGGGSAPRTAVSQRSAIGAHTADIEPSSPPRGQEQEQQEPALPLSASEESRPAQVENSGSGIGHPSSSPSPRTRNQELAMPLSASSANTLAETPAQVESRGNVLSFADLLADEELERK